MKRTKCEECGGKIISKRVEYKFLGEYIGAFPAEVCTKCGEEVFTEETSDKITEVVKKKGLWGLNARTKVEKVGHSLDIRINEKIAKFLKLRKGEEVIILPENRHKLIVLV